MKKRIFAFILALTMLFLLGCDRKGEKTDYGGFVDTKTGIEYTFCTPRGLYAVSRGEDFITVGDRVYAEVQFEDTSRFLCLEDSGELLLLRAKDLEEPTLATFNPIAAQIYTDDNAMMITNFYADDEYLPDDKKGINPTQDSGICRQIAETITNNEAQVLPAEIDRDEMFYIRLLSQDYPGLYYAVVFYGHNGRYYLYDRATGKVVFAPRDVIIRMVGE